MGPLLKRKWDKHSLAVLLGWTQHMPASLEAAMERDKATFPDQQEWARKSLSRMETYNRACGIVHAGLQLFDMLFSVVVDHDGVPKQDAKRAVNALDPVRGRRASVFLARAMGALLFRLAQFETSHLNAERYVAAAELLDEFFPIPDSDRQELEAIASSVSDLGEGLEAAQARYVEHALRLALGDDVVSSLSYFAPADFVERVFAPRRLSLAWGMGNEIYLTEVDPEALTSTSR